MNADVVGFFQWWLVTHDVWSTVLTPGLSCLWAIYTENNARAWVAGIWSAISIWLLFI